MKKRILLLSAILSGCSTIDLTDQKTVHIKSTSTFSSHGLEIATFPAQVRGSYIYATDDGKIVCAEPFTDVAAQSSLNATVSAVNNLSTALNKSLEASNSRSGSTNNQYGSNSSSETEGLSRSGSSDRSAENSRSYENSFGNTFGTTSQAEQSVNAGLNAVTEIIALEGRTQFVLLAREMLFRTCEAAANGKLDSNESVVAKQHAIIFKALEDMIATQKTKADAAKAQADAAKSKADAQKAKAEKEQLEAVIAAADKLDPKILALFGGSSDQIILKQYLKEYDKCMSDAGTDQNKQKKCKDEYNKKLSRLSGE